MVRYAIKRFGLSTNRACKIIGIWRSMLSYKVKDPKKDTKLRKRFRELSEEYPKWGCPTMHMVAKRERLVVNKKRSERVYYRVEKLSIRRKKRRRKARHTRGEQPKVTGKNERWAMDFVHDSLWEDRKFRILTVIDTYTKEAIAIEVGTSINGIKVAEVLDGLLIWRGIPKMITVDNGPEFAGKVLDKWAYENGVKLDFIRPGKPVDNCFIESFNGTLRKNCLNIHYFTNIKEAKNIIEEWRKEYNEFKPHSSLCGLTPAEFAGLSNRCSADNLSYALVQ